MAVSTRANNKEANTHSDALSLGDIEIEFEDTPTETNTAPNTTTTTVGARGNPTPTPTDPSTAHLNHTIASQIEKDFNELTVPHAANDTEREASLSSWLGDQSLLHDQKTYLTMSDNSNTVNVIYGVTLVPSPYQTGRDQQVISFFDKRRAEVPSTLWVNPDVILKATILPIPTLEHILEFQTIDPNIELVPADNAWEKTRLPALAPFPPQWANQLRDKALKPIELAFKLDSDLKSWDESLVKKMKPLQNWIHAACVRAVSNDQREGSVLKLPWRSFLFIQDSAFKWASSRLDTLTQPWAHRHNVQQTGSDDGALAAAMMHTSSAVTQQTQLMNHIQGISSNASIPQIIGGTNLNLGMLSEYEIAKLLPFCGLTWHEQHKLPKFWNRFKACRDKEARLNFLQTRYSYESTDDADINIQVTEQLVKDLTKLSFGRGPDVSFEKCNEGITPFAFVPLEEKEARKREIEEEARRNATSTTISDHKNKKKHIPVMRLKNDALKSMLKNLTYVGTDIFGVESPCFKLIKQADIEVKRTITQGTVFEEEQALGFVFTALKEARYHFATECTVDDMKDPNGLRPKLRYLAPITHALQSGLSTARHDMPLDWRKHYPTRHYQIMSGAYNNNNQNQGTGDRITTGQQSTSQGGQSQRRFQVNDRINNALRPIVAQHGRRIHLASLLRHANTNYDQLLGDRFANHCIKAVLTGQCHQNCTRVHENPPPEDLINRILQHINPGIAQHVQRGPLPPAPGTGNRR